MLSVDVAIMVAGDGDEAAADDDAAGVAVRPTTACGVFVKVFDKSTAGLVMGVPRTWWGLMKDGKDVHGMISFPIIVTRELNLRLTIDIKRHTGRRTQRWWCWLRWRKSLNEVQWRWSIRL